MAASTDSPMLICEVQMVRMAPRDSLALVKPICFSWDRTENSIAFWGLLSFSGVGDVCCSSLIFGGGGRG
eukprot:CAMPEP_0195536908 /NCGR_PEP_ID=MMETSP0794_2-20130614/46930_1 /TAXON_ID=515487 /ORGANISM="Stephanopyxis turris, Strain CCMP 815" /LENGTH=69 /DNA_ID=CAMNT_0040670469 /DNA_START=107 /DNA_END=313 /DNA_ORIENTATION=+